MPTSASSVWPDTVHPDLIAVKRSVFDPLGALCRTPVVEADNAEYGAFTFSVDGHSVRSRAGKLTPTKVGLFVTVWARAANGSTRPFSAEDAPDFLLITVREGSEFGQFVFPRDAVVEHGIVSTNSEGGKRGFRVYPPWSPTTNAQARRTQAWQVRYFLDLKSVDLDRARNLYALGCNRSVTHPAH